MSTLCKMIINVLNHYSLGIIYNKSAKFCKTSKLAIYVAPLLKACITNHICIRSVRKSMTQLAIQLTVRSEMSSCDICSYCSKILLTSSPFLLE